MRKCICCKECEQVWTWQPFGPGDDTKVFIRPGSHYRGYPALPICDECKRVTEEGGVLNFTYKRQSHMFIYQAPPPVCSECSSVIQSGDRAEQHPDGRPLCLDCYARLYSTRDAEDAQYVDGDWRYDMAREDGRRW